MFKPGNTNRGFTLIEMLITVLVIGLLTAVALPAYTSYMVKARRASAQSFIVNVLGAEQRTLLDQRSFSAALSAIGAVTPDDVASYYTFTARVSAPNGTVPADADDLALDALITASLPATPGGDCIQVPSLYLLVKAVPIGKQASDGVLVARGLCSNRIRTSAYTGGGGLSTAAKW